MRFQRRALLAPLFLFAQAFVFPGCDSCNPPSPSAPPAATVEGDGPAIVTMARGKEFIWLEEIKYAISKMGLEVRDLYGSHTRQNDLVRRLAASRLLVIEAREQGLDRTPEFRSQIMAYREGQLASQFLEKIESDWKAAYKEPEEKDLYEYYLTHSEKYKKGEKVRLSLILVHYSDSMSVEDKLKAEKKIEEAQARLRLGEPFEKVAEKYSEDSSNINGGDIGYIDRTFDFRVSQVAFNKLKYVGDISEIIEDPRFKRIIMLTDRKEDEAIPFEEVKEEIGEKREKDLRSEYREAQIKETVDATLVTDYPDRLKFDVDACNGDTTVLSEFNGAPPITVDEYCGALLDRASFNPGLLEPGSHRMGLLKDLEQRRCLAAQGMKDGLESRRAFRYEMRRMEERILFQIFNRHFVDNIYQLSVNEDTLKAYYNANTPKFRDPETGAPMVFETVRDQVLDEFVQSDKQNQYGKFIEGLWDKYGAVLDQPTLEKHRDALVAVAQGASVQP